MQRHQSPERPMILHQISSLMYPKIQRRQVIMNVLHPGCARPPRWSPPVLWSRFEDGLASICILVHSFILAVANTQSHSTGGSTRQGHICCLQKLIYAICYSQLSITFAEFDMFVCISFMCLRVHVDLIQPLAARNNKCCSRSCVQCFDAVSWAAGRASGL